MRASLTAEEARGLGFYREGSNWIKDEGALRITSKVQPDGGMLTGGEHFKVEPRSKVARADGLYFDFRDYVDRKLAEMIMQKPEDAD